VLSPHEVCGVESVGRRSRHTPAAASRRQERCEVDLALLGLLWRLHHALRLLLGRLLRRLLRLLPLLCRQQLCQQRVLLGLLLQERVLLGLLLRRRHPHGRPVLLHAGVAVLPARLLLLWLRGRLHPAAVVRMGCLLHATAVLLEGVVLRQGMGLGLLPGRAVAGGGPLRHPAARHALHARRAKQACQPALLLLVLLWWLHGAGPQRGQHGGLLGLLRLHVGRHLRRGRRGHLLLRRLPVGGLLGLLRLLCQTLLLAQHLIQALHSPAEGASQGPYLYLSVGLHPAMQMQCYAHRVYQPTQARYARRPSAQSILGLDAYYASCKDTI
jgi:hypothetical protein